MATMKFRNGCLLHYSQRSAMYFHIEQAVLNCVSEIKILRVNIFRHQKAESIHLQKSTSFR